MIQAKEQQLDSQQISLILNEANNLAINQNSSQQNCQYLIQKLKQKFSIIKSFSQIINIIKKQSQLIKHTDNKQSINLNILSKQTQSKKQYICKSKRKIKPISINQTKNYNQKIQKYENSTSQCFIYFQKRKKNGQSSSSGITLNENCQWLYNQHFYSTIDRYFFKQQKIFQKILNQANIKHQNLSYQEHKIIRQSLPKPKLFDTQFLNNINQKLQYFRNQYRATLKHKGKQSQFNVGRQVNALHPVCGHIHPGNILAIYKQNYYMVKFKQFILGTQRVHDTCISTKQSNNIVKVVVQQVDYQIMGLAIRLLQYKSDLIKKLRQFNKLAQQSIINGEELNNQFYQHYGWIGSTINIIGIGIRHVISKFRLRGISAANQQKFGKHFTSIAVNPLNLMRQQLKKSEQKNDKQASRQIKNIIKMQKQNQIDKYTNQLYQKNRHYINGISNQDKKQQIQILLKKLISIIINLRQQNKNFSPDEDKNMIQLLKFLYEKYPEASNEIYDTIINICSKQSDNG